VAGTSDPTAGATSSFSLTLGRGDREQNIQALSTTLPEGLLALVSKVTKCPEALASQASLDACPAGSQIGTTTVAVGSGSDPYYETGKVFFTGPYDGAPFGLSIVVPATAGPFNLGNVVVRAALFIDPHTTQVTALSSPLPQILDGIPLHIRSIDLTLNAREFTLNPTSCTQMSIAGSIQSTTGAIAGVSSPFAAAGCKNLAFAPKLTASTTAKASKAKGASLLVKVSYPAGALGADANIKSVKVELPKALPSRLTTIQQACTETVFNQNPASCPAGSDIGTVTATTPVLPVPASGPMFLVSHGGAAFPDVVAILQGEGVTVELTGTIDIKHGVTSSAFASVPDAPITTFAMNLPEGPHSGLGANLPPAAKNSFCGQPLTMPTTITAQNGKTIKQTTKITVTGCPKAVRHERKKTRKKKRKK
jgi:hypothetical protein